MIRTLREHFRTLQLAVCGTPKSQDADIDGACPTYGRPVELSTALIDWPEGEMAKNTGEGFRRGSVNDRTQIQNPQNGNWVKRDTDTGRFTEQKRDGTPFKGVAREVDERRR